ncbi:MAG: PilW family protein [Zoogloeaceae bacterium]|jgi:type IV pilus assembly protein PilW|nr:PilW family protein [Zoogloeaceae bacterium]
MKTEAVSRRHRARGLSLVEVLVALSIGVIILGAVLYTYIGSRSTYRLNYEMSRLQENGRIVMNMLERDLRMSAYAGCAGLSTLKTPDAFVAARDDIRNGVSAEKITSIPAFTGTIGDIIYRLRAIAPSLNVGIEAIAADNKSLTVRYPDNAIPDGLVLISDCRFGELLPIKMVTPAGSGQFSLGLDEEITQNFTPEYSRAFILPMAAGEIGISYDIVAVPSPEGGANILALTRNGDELTDGIEAFRVCFGLGNAYASDSDDESKVTEYRLPESVTTDAEKESITTVQVDMLLASASANVLEADVSQTFLLCGGDPAATVTRNDRRARKLFSTTVSLRNKVWRGS